MVIVVGGWWCSISGSAALSQISLAGLTASYLCAERGRADWAGRRGVIIVLCSTSSVITSQPAASNNTIQSSLSSVSTDLRVKHLPPDRSLETESQFQRENDGHNQAGISTPSELRAVQQEGGGGGGVSVKMGRTQQPSRQHLPPAVSGKIS